MNVGRRLWAGVLVAVCLGVLITPLLRTTSTNADIASPWLSTTLPTLENLGNLGPNDQLTNNMVSNSDCQKREVITRPKRIVPFPQAKVSYTDCVVDTAYGAVGNNSYLQRQGTTVSGTVRSYFGGSTTLVPIPRSPSGLTLGGGTPYGSYLFFYDDLNSTISSTASYNGEVTHKLPATSTAQLRDQAGNLMAATTDSMTFSAGGEWMIVDIPSVAMVRVNTVTRHVLPFGDAINYKIGLGPAYKTAISPDGRYVVVASRTFDILKLYDLSTCAAVPATITTKVACSSKDLLPYMRQKVAGFTSLASVRFRSNYTLDMYVNSKSGNVTTTSHQIMTAAGQESTGYQYLALGDSFASGEGAYNYKAITDAGENKCHLSQRSYPYLISSTLGFGQYESVACSGAKIEDITRKDDSYSGQIKDGEIRKDRSPDDFIPSFIPGYLGQVEFLEKYRPNIITISAAGNDIGFGDKIKRCVDSDTCFSTYEDRLEIVNEINAQFYRLTGMYEQIRKVGDPTMRIYVLGYPQIGDPDGNCALNVHFNHGELIFAQQLISYLNTMIKTAAANQGVYYVDVEQAFAGHRLCETDSWNVAVNGLTAGDDAPNFLNGPAGNESFHPNAFGHELYKTAILEKTSNLTAPMPNPNPAAVMSDPSPTLDLLQMPKTNRSIKIIRNITGTNGGVIETGKTWASRTPTVRGIQVGAKVKAWLNSDPYYIGEFTVDLDGTIPLEITLPNFIAKGEHTLHLYAQNTVGEEIDFYTTVTVVHDDPSGCVLVAMSGQDADKDGVDDACDPFIDQPPIIVEPEPEPEPPIVVEPLPEQPPIDPIAIDPPETPAEEKLPLVVTPDITPNLPPAEDIDPPDPIEVIINPDPEPNLPLEVNEDPDPIPEPLPRIEVIKDPPAEVLQDPITPEPDNDSPQETNEPTTEILNPKPSENNPETIAGSEQQNPQPTPSSPAVLTINHSPSQVLNNNSDIPQVQGTNIASHLIKPTTPPKTIASVPPTLPPQKTTPLTFLIPILVLFSICSLAIIKLKSH